MEINFEMSGAGPLLTLIHSAGDNLDVWEEQVEEFSRHYLVLRYDLRGHGGSSDDQAGYSLDRLVQDLRHLLTSLRLRHTYIVGHDLGAAVGLAYAAEYSWDVKGLVVAHSNGGLEPTPELRRRLEGWVEAVEQGGAESVLVEQAESFFTPRLLQYSNGVLEGYRRLRLSRPPRSYAAALRLQMRPHPIDYARVVCPTFALIGAEDPILPPSSIHQLQHHIVGLWFQTVSTGHISPIERPVFFNDAVLGFLREEAARYDVPPAGYHSTVYQAAELG